MDCQSVESEHFDVFELARHLLYQRDTLITRKEGAFLRVFADADDEAIDQPAASTNDIQMTQMNGVEDACINGDALDGGIHSQSPRRLRLRARVSLPGF